MWREILGLDKRPNTITELIVPKRSFNDVVLPASTRRQLFEALTQIEKHSLIFGAWGLGERHPTGMGLVFNFAGAPGTGKTICAEAISFALGKKLLRVRYSELESCWAGETGKNIRSVFKEARAGDAVLFFDEADSIATRRFSSVQIGYERESNLAVNILLKEVEEFDGVVIFATNLASNFDPAFERRIRTHVLFERPDAELREQIWRLQIHPDKTPLADDVDFEVLAHGFDLSGGDIRNAVLKGAQMAAAEEGEDARKVIHQRHLIAASQEVMRARSVMAQNALDGDLPPSELQQALTQITERLQTAEQDIQTSRDELELLSGEQRQYSAGLEELRGSHAALQSAQTEQQTALAAWTETGQDREKRLAGLAEQLASLEARLARSTLVPLPVPVTWLLLLALLLAGAGVGFVLRP